MEKEKEKEMEKEMEMEKEKEKEKENGEGKGKSCTEMEVFCQIFSSISAHLRLYTHTQTTRKH